MEPERPVVTISDPNADPASIELLERGREPWRPSPTQRRVAVLTAAVLLVAVATGSWVRYDRHERALDLASVAAVRLAVTVGVTTDPGDAAPRLQLRNDGPDAVDLREVWLEPAGAHAPLSAALLRAGFLDLPLRDRRPCGAELLTAPLDRVVVRGRTARGADFVHRVRLFGQAEMELNGQARQRCGYLTPSEAFFPIVSMTRLLPGPSVRLRLTLRNESALPLQLIDLRSLVPGTSLHGPSLPLTLRPTWRSDVRTAGADDTSEPTGSPVGADRFVTARVTLTVDNCERFGQAVGYGPAPELSATVRGPHRSEEVGLALLTDYDAQSYALWNRLTMACLVAEGRAPASGH